LALRRLTGFWRRRNTCPILSVGEVHVWSRRWCKSHETGRIERHSLLNWSPWVVGHVLSPGPGW
jgi:hypothetical protein